MKNILVPIGTSNTGETLQYAVDFASEFSAQVFVMDVFTVSSKAGSLVNISEKVAESLCKQISQKQYKMNVNEVQQYLGNGIEANNAKDYCKNLIE